MERRGSNSNLVAVRVEGRGVRFGSCYSQPITGGKGSVISSCCSQAEGREKEGFHFVVDANYENFLGYEGGKG